ncbi:fimbrial protein PefA [Salmonella enterica subsp. enterica]|nr:fimbrial protein PefA [Salmonella enterica subsp. enterica]EDP8715413.1 fimbrial protein PefA [Salmonella enterica subsp. enterica]
MKKNLLAVSALALAVMSGSALAASGDVQFIGVVTDTTCDVNPGVNGSVSNLVQLGTAETGNTGPLVNFSLKPDMTQSGCQGLTNTNAVTIGWAGPFDANGLTAQSGTATDAWTEIKHTNATVLTTITASSLSSVMTGDVFIANGGQGATFTAQLNGGATAGDYQSAAAYVVAYN